MLPTSLSAYPKFLDQVKIALAVTLSDVAQQAAALADELQQAAAGCEVLLVDLQVLGELLDPFRIDADLHRSPTGVLSVHLGALDSCLFFLTCNHMNRILPEKMPRRKLEGPDRETIKIIDILDRGIFKRPMDRQAAAVAEMLEQVL